MIITIGKKSNQTKNLFIRNVHVDPTDIQIIEHFFFYKRVAGYHNNYNTFPPLN